MKRRSFLKQASITVGSTALLPNLVSAQEATECKTPPSLFSANAEISRNHGHEFSLSLDNPIELLRKASNGDLILEIQGNSRHPHSVTLDADQLAQALSGEVITVDSSVDAGHSHTLTLSILKDEESDA